MRKSIVIAACAGVALAGCGKESGNVEVKTQGAKITTAGTAKSVALPDNFPKDVPIIPSGTVKVASAIEGNLTVMMTATASPEDAIKYYKENLGAQGWKIGDTMAMGNLTVLTARKDSRECGVQVSSAAGQGTAISLSVKAKGG